MAGSASREPPPKPYLIAPPFHPPRRRGAAKSAPDAAVASSHGSAHDSIDETVRNAYKKVRRERDRERRKRVASALKESRDGVIDGLLGEAKVSTRGSNGSTVGGASHGTSGSRKKRRSVDGDQAASPKKRKKKRRKRSGRTDNGAGEITNGEGCANGSRQLLSNGTKPPPSAGEMKSPPPLPDQLHPSQIRTLVFPRLPSNDCPVHQMFHPPQLGSSHGGTEGTEAPPNLAKPKGRSGYTLTIQSSNQNKPTSIATTTAHRPLLLEGAHPPRPKTTNLIMLNASFAAECEPSLKHVPYFGDDDDEDVYSELFDTKERKMLYERGPPYQQEEAHATIDAVLDLLAKEKPGLLDDVELYDKVANGKPGPEGEGRDAPSNVQKLERIYVVLSQLAGVDETMVRERHSLHLAQDGKGEHPDPLDEPKSNEGVHKRPPSSPGHRKNSDTKVAVPYESIMDSYRDLFCRRCFTYDCNIHGNLPKANVDLLGELAVQKELEGHWKEFDADIASKKVSTNGKRKGCGSEDLTPAQQSICNRAYTIFRGDVDKIAHVIGASQCAVKAFVKSNKISLPENKFVTAHPPGKKNGSRYYSSMKNYNQKWLRHIQSKTIQPTFLPCDHDEPCNNDTCSCVQNGFFCTKHCGWASKSPNFFRGCECKAGQCRANNCSCYASRRECDPDLCRNCGACSDSPGGPCRNDNISMNRGVRVMVAESTVKEAGWGLFTKYPLKKGDFVVEYVGEVISQEEAERRGVIYDKMNMSYLFNLSSDFVVDATRKGNLARYANHSSTPNIEPRMFHVNGDMRIGFYAKIDIDAQSELFFDYRYDDKMDNDLIYKPDHSVNFDWMNKSNQGRKKDP